MVCSDEFANSTLSRQSHTTRIPRFGWRWKRRKTSSMFAGIDWPRLASDLLQVLSKSATISIFDIAHCFCLDLWELFWRVILPFQLITVSPFHAMCSGVVMNSWCSALFLSPWIMQVIAEVSEDLGEARPAEFPALHSFFRLFTLCTDDSWKCIDEKLVLLHGIRNGEQMTSLTHLLWIDHADSVDYEDIPLTYHTYNYQ